MSNPQPHKLHRQPLARYDPWRERDLVSFPKAEGEVELVDVFHELAPQLAAHDIAPELAQLWLKLDARGIPYSNVRPHITGRGRESLFGIDLRLGIAPGLRERLTHLWNEGQRYTPISEDEIRKLHFLQYYQARGARVFADEECALWSIQTQAKRGPGLGFLDSGERALLNDFWNYRHEFRSTVTFEDLGLVWRNPRDMFEPAFAKSRYPDATFAQLSSHYFKRCISKLKKSSLLAAIPPEGFDEFKDAATEHARFLHLVHRERLRIVREAERLSKIREQGLAGMQAADRGWQKFLEEDLYRKYPPPSLS